MRGGSVPQRNMINMYLNMNNANNIDFQNNIGVIQMNNFINNNMNFVNINPNINMINSPNNFNNYGGGRNFNQMNNMFPMNNLNQVNNINMMNNNQKMNQMNNVNQINNRYNFNQMNNMNNINNVNNMNNMNNMNNVNNMNNMNNINNINNMNNMNNRNNNFKRQNNFMKPVISKSYNDNNFAFAFRHSNSNEIPNQNNFFINNNIKIFNSSKSNSINFKEKEIQMTFSFMSGQLFSESGKPYEKLSEVINRFKSKCPEELKKFLSHCICNGKPADINKTLEELGIKNEQKILFIQNKNANNQFKMTRREKKRFNKYKVEYYSLKILNNIAKNKNQSYSNEFESYSSFYNSKDKSASISVKEHMHLLAYCLTNFDWKCNLCNINYDKKKGRYYCSKCDFNICEKCHYDREYVTKKSFPENTVPSNLNVKDNFLVTDYHEEHPLVYCRCSKNLTCFNEWTCDNCKSLYTNDKWLFYCTLCNFHLCLSCCGYA